MWIHFFYGTREKKKNLCEKKFFFSSSKKKIFFPTFKKIQFGNLLHPKFFSINNKKIKLSWIKYFKWIFDEFNRFLDFFLFNWNFSSGFFFKFAIYWMTKFCIESFMVVFIGLVFFLTNCTNFPQNVSDSQGPKTSMNNLWKIINLNIWLESFIKTFCT